MERRAFLQATAVAGLAAQSKQEWRNRQPGMAYRQLGRTGLMISEVVSGGDPIKLDNYQHINLALEMGLNYLDMASAYNRGDTERAYGKLAQGRRDKVFMTTKVSGLQAVRNALYKEVFDGLPADKQAAVRRRADQMLADSGAMKPGYFLDYYPGIRNQPPPAYLSNAMAVDYAHKVDANKKFRDHIVATYEGSLQRAATDHFDIVMIPHGACCPEELDIPEIYETFLNLKRQGKVRFLGTTSHTDPAGVLRKAAQLGYYDVVQLAYNVVNGGWLEQALAEATSKGVGIIAMKAAMAVATHHKSLQPTPQWRIDKVNRIVPGDMKAPLKAYIWALQNPRISAVVSNLWDETYVRENLGVAGRKVELLPA
jgi:aryl-alcohol dehydrogenase-like predicted oxidoreductase